MRYGCSILCAIGAVMISGCSTTTSIDNSAGRATVYEDTRSAGKVQGVGVESQDILAVTDQMTRDILGNAQVSGRSVAPRIILDSEYFSNESSSRINKNMLTDRLRTLLRSH